MSADKLSVSGNSEAGLASIPCAWNREERIHTKKISHHFCKFGFNPSCCQEIIGFMEVCSKNQRGVLISKSLWLWLVPFQTYLTMYLRFTFQFGYIPQKKKKKEKHVLCGRILAFLLPAHKSLGIHLFPLKWKVSKISWAWLDKFMWTSLVTSWHFKMLVIIMKPFVT